MSLWEVSEALTAASAPTQAACDLGAALDDLTNLSALDALVTEELEEANHHVDDFCEVSFVDNVFGRDPTAALPPVAEARSRQSSTAEEALFAMCLPAQEIGELEMGEPSVLDYDLLAMLRPEGDYDACTFPKHLEPCFVPASGSPTSVSAMFGNALSGESSPCDERCASSNSTAEFHSAVSQKLEGSAGLISLPQTTVGVSLAGGKAETSRNGAERKEWTTVEDEIIRASVIVHGCRWRRIAAELPGRSDDAVRNRWNRLKAEEKTKERAASPDPTQEGAPAAAGPPPSKRNASASSEEGSKPERVSWTRAEDATILRSVLELGHKWNKLAERLPGRTDHAIRNRFHRLQSMMEDKQREPPLQPLALGYSEPIGAFAPLEMPALLLV